MPPFALSAKLAVVLFTLWSSTAALHVTQTAAKKIDSKGAYQQEIEQWRAKQEASLKADDGWLTVAGLYWLKQGENRFGTSNNNDIILPPNSVAANAGSFVFDNGKTTLILAPNVHASLNGVPVTTGTVRVRSEVDGKPDLIQMNDLTFFIIKRGDTVHGARYAIRLRDKNSAARKTFTGRQWFPVKEAYNIQAKFIAYDQPKTLPILTIIGDLEPSPNPGYVTFTLAGKEYRLEAQSSGERLFFNFRDETSGKDTYPAGRFLYTDKPTNGVVALDFNKAYNPPCAFTKFATCPLPPRENHLPVSVEAGEKTYHITE